MEVHIQGLHQHEISKQKTSINELNKHGYKKRFRLRPSELYIEYFYKIKRYEHTTDNHQGVYTTISNI